MGVPKVGDSIYVDDGFLTVGGLGTVSCVEKTKSGVHFVEVEENPGVSMLWEDEGGLGPIQDELRQQFGSKRTKAVD